MAHEEARDMDGAETSRAGRLGRCNLRLSRPRAGRRLPSDAREATVGGDPVAKVRSEARPSNSRGLPGGRSVSGGRPRRPGRIRASVQCPGAPGGTARSALGTPRPRPAPADSSLSHSLAHVDLTYRHRRAQTGGHGPPSFPTAVSHRSAEGQVAVITERRRDRRAVARASHQRGQAFLTGRHWLRRSRRQGRRSPAGPPRRRRSTPSTSRLWTRTCGR